MAHAPSLPQERTARRVSKALGIVVRQECVPCEDHPGFFQVRDTETGSGTTYIAAAHRCTCPDYIMRGKRCKHSIAVEKEEAALAEYAAGWDVFADDAARVALDDMPGDFLSTGLNFDDDVMLASSPRCPMCSAPLVTDQFYIGGRGYVGFEVCSGDGSHYGKRLS